MKKNGNAALIVILFVIVVAVIVMLFWGGDKSASESESGKNGTTTHSGSSSETVPMPTKPPGTENSKTDSISRTATSTVAGRGQGGLRGRVIKENGEGIENVSIEVEKPVARMFITNSSDAAPVVVSTKTDKDGYYQFDRIASFDQYVISARHASYPPARLSNIQVYGEQKTEVADLTMKTGYSLQVRVKDPTGNPIGNASLTIEPTMREAFLRATKDSEPYTATADSSGFYEFQNLPGGQMALTARAKGYGTRTLATIFLQGNQKQFSHEVVLDAGKWLTGKVIDDAGRPVPNAKVEATSFSSQNPSRGSGVSNEVGQFTIEDLPDGSYVLVVTAENYTVKRENRVSIGDPEITVILVPQGIIEGRVLVKGTGEAVKNFTIEVRQVLQNKSFLPTGKERKSFNSKDGTFTLSGLDSGMSYVLSASAEGLAKNYSQPFTITGAGVLRGVEILLSAGGKVRGMVMDAKDKAPIAGALVLARENNAFDNSLYQFMGSTLPTDSTLPSAITAADGSFTLDHVAPGGFQIEVQAEGYMNKQMTDLQALENSSIEVGSVFMNAGALVRGLVSDSGGKPVAGAQVNLRNLAAQSLFARNTRTDAQGKFLIRYVPAGEYQLSASVSTAETGNPFPVMSEHKKNRQTFNIKEGEELQVNLSTN